MTVTTLPRLGFLGVGWIGRHRMQALSEGGLAEVAAVADPQDEALAAAAAAAPRAERAATLEDLLERDLDGVVIATPSALHAEQATAALERGLAVFCQKPLARNAGETRRVLAAARKADRLLGVDLSYRHVEALRAACKAIEAGEIGRFHSLDLAFHNAYGPDKPWFTDPELAGGGCLIDLGTHLVDLALWLTGADEVAVKTARTLSLHGHEVEDQASAELALGEVRARLACSWFQPAGGECAFECTAWGSEGAVSVRNVHGSFYDFRAELWKGTSSEILVEPPDPWGGRAIAAWAERLAIDPSYDPAADELELLARTIDDVYAEAGR
ncbi:MAG TPA: Gfo/Idh/MocA family oxidoreductase [Solirubrobacterales bacterium]|jgi:predicted dehydrogenase|nr:Gfo/Idh/MocA family oxidoreductase [Solirubrobacterales bacterium]